VVGHGSNDRGMIPDKGRGLFSVITSSFLSSQYWELSPRDKSEGRVKLSAYLGLLPMIGMHG
jgi:hypothetical protein